MASITIRNLDEATKTKLRLSAARHGCSMEEVARRILRRGVISQESKKGVGSRIHQRFTEAGGVDLNLPPRSTPRVAPQFFEDEE